MASDQTNSPAPSFDRRNTFIERVESAAAIAAHRQTFIEAIDASLAALRDESRRTLALIQHQRISPLYRLRYRRPVPQAVLSDGR